MNSTSFAGKKLVPFILQNEIREIIDRIGAQINADYNNDNPLFLSILNGSFVFTADLMRCFEGDCQVDFIRYRSYQGMQNGKVERLMDLNIDIAGRHVIIVEDIIDTGNTIELLLEDLKIYKPLSLKVCTFLFKPNKFQKNYPIHYIGKSITDEFIIGYGLDCNGYGRNLPHIYQIKES